MSLAIWSRSEHCCLLRSKLSGWFLSESMCMCNPTYWNRTPFLEIFSEEADNSILAWIISIPVLAQIYGGWEGRIQNSIRRFLRWHCMTCQNCFKKHIKIHQIVPSNKDCKRTMLDLPWRQHLTTNEKFFRFQNNFSS